MRHSRLTQHEARRLFASYLLKRESSIEEALLEVSRAILHRMPGTCVQKRGHITSHFFSHTLAIPTPSGPKTVEVGFGVTNDDDGKITVVPQIRMLNKGVEDERVFEHEMSACEAFVEERLRAWMTYLGPSMVKTVEDLVSGSRT